MRTIFLRTQTELRGQEIESQLLDQREQRRWRDVRGQGQHARALPDFERVEFEIEGGCVRLRARFENCGQAILGDLLPRHVRMQVFRALMESLAGEYGARMTAMEAATKNAKEMIDILTIQYNKARQEKITKELLDIVGGAEALKQGAEA